MLSSCFTYKDVEISSVQGFEIKNFSGKGIEALVTVEVNNPNNYDITVMDTDLDLFINSREMGKARIKENIKLNKRSKEKYSFTVLADFKSAAGGLLSSLFTLFSSKSIDLRLKGTAKGRALFITRKVKVDLSEKVKL